MSDKAKEGTFRLLPERVTCPVCGDDLFPRIDRHYLSQVACQGLVYVHVDCIHDWRPPCLVE